MENALLVPEMIQVERSARANEQALVVSNLIMDLDIGKNAADSLIYELSKLLLLTEMDCTCEGYAMGLAAAHDTKKQKKGKWLI